MSGLLTGIPSISPLTVYNPSVQRRVLHYNGVKECTLAVLKFISLAFLSYSTVLHTFSVDEEYRCL
jgi:hypothetical protein